MVEALFLLLLGSPWPIAIWLAYTVGQYRERWVGHVYTLVVLLTMSAIYVSGYRLAERLAADHKATEATFALATMTFEAYLILALALLARGRIPRDNAPNRQDSK